ncbi:MULTISPECIES: alpha-amylase family glycosyl hydrolase [unclassified Mycoplasma]|uniref:alpha-amylase family glycosyl hydrolase n=1 Tax=unclassified Mycoplasma TaxID=2683645 RepID=UPI00211B79C5|nr:MULTISPECIES: alpha-amylase family glycosyl hydrolase [unclassified Mycoplasma]UUM19743.1 alpha-amylase family glycosyl hydrolase [Mycoplasma sp. 1578d]UUM24727.1 alpha-amylase family glycosyl hydrolase [Mycoplasma sp. 3686d]
MNFKTLSDGQIKQFDQQFAYQHNDLGVVFLNEQIQIKLWQPLAKNVNILIFKDINSNECVELSMNKQESIWIILLDSSFQYTYYQFKITHQDNTQTFALDPYAKSMAPFNHSKEKVGKGFIFDPNKEIAKPVQLKNKIIHNNQAIIYELHIRDYTSLLEQNFSTSKGTFQAALQANIFQNLNELNFTHVQLLPIQSTYMVNEFDQSIIQHGQGQGWNTNYNWGYDPHNYFTINGIYSSNPRDSLARIKEFSEFVNQAHKNGIGIILDVVFNHLFHNDILNNILPGYYFRENAKVHPVDQPPLATQRTMTRKLMIDVLKYFVQYFDVDGFRFDLSSFFDKETHEVIAQELRKIKPNIILHGEAWPYSDLEFKSTYIKGYNSNNFEFGYFNDSLRNSITCYEGEKEKKGLIFQNTYQAFQVYVSSIPGNIKNYNWGDIEHSTYFYDLFNKDTTTNLAYVACHDGLTLWDKIAVHAQTNDFVSLLEMYRKALIMLYTTQGRKLILAGTELLHSKPCDITGDDPHKCHPMNIDDFLNLKPDQNSVHENSYKTSDYVNGLKWNNLNNKQIKQHIYQFMSNLNAFKLQYDHFNLITPEQINEKLSFIKVDYGEKLIIYKVVHNNVEIVVMHNFSDNSYQFNQYKECQTLFSSLINSSKANLLAPHESKILKR